MAGAFQSDAFQGDAFQASTYTLTADPGTLTLTGQSVLLDLSGSSILLVDPGTLALTGQSSNLSVGYTLGTTAGTLTLTGENVGLHSGYYVTANSGTLTLTGQSCTLRFGRVLTVTTGEAILTGQVIDLDAQIDHVYTLGFLIDMLPAEVTGNYKRFQERLYVDSVQIPIKSWRYEETDQNLSGTLAIELARNSDRSAITRIADIDFQIGVNGTYETLLSNGYLKRKDYNISRQGIGPTDSVTFTALPEMAARLNTVPETNTVFYDPAKHNVTADDFEGVYDKDHNYTPPVVTSVPNLDLYELFDLILVDACGFTEYITNIPNFPIAIVEFAAGESYMNGLSGLIGMFEPELLPYEGGTKIQIRDGTSGTPSGMPTPRQLDTSDARQVGVAQDVNIVDALLIHVTEERFFYDYYEDRTDNTTSIEGAAGGFSTVYYDISIDTTYRDYFRTEHPDRPIKTDIIREVRTTSLGITTVHRSTENFSFDGFGRLRQRIKEIEAYVPTPGTFVLALIEVLSETENITYAMHPYQPRQYYIREREINTEGLVFIDGENQQLGENYSRSILDAFRAGNVVNTMTSDTAKIHTFKEFITPMRNNFLRIRRTEIDWLANVKHEDRNELRQGEIGVNIFIQDQTRIYILSPGETTINGTIEHVNMGELPLDTAIVLGERILENRNVFPNRVSFSLIGIDNSLQKGTPITAVGRNGEALGTYIIESRSMEGSQEGYFMTIQTRQAD